MTLSAACCPYCQSDNIRRSRRRSKAELLRMSVGVYPFRCNSCSQRFWSSIWLFSTLRFAKCPKCLGMDLLNEWPRKSHRLSPANRVLIGIGGKRCRCLRCRYNFVRLRPILLPLVDPAAGAENTEPVPQSE